MNFGVEEKIRPVAKERGINEIPNDKHKGGLARGDETIRISSILFTTYRTESLGIEIECRDLACASRTGVTPIPAKPEPCLISSLLAR